MYATDDEPNEPFSLDDFVANNEDLDPEDLASVTALAVGESAMLGGGAGAEMTIRRIS